jgi:hypothetical protein
MVCDYEYRNECEWVHDGHDGHDRRMEKKTVINQSWYVQ